MKVKLIALINEHLQHKHLFYKNLKANKEKPILKMSSISLGNLRSMAINEELMIRLFLNYKIKLKGKK